MLLDLDRRLFVAQQDLSQLLKRTRTLFAELFCEGSVAMADTMLLVKQGPALNWGVFDMGLRIGCAMILLIWWIFDMMVDESIRPGHFSVWKDPALPVFRGVGCMLLLLWLWGLMIFVWTSTRINYIFMFDLDARSPSWRSIANEASLSTIVFLSLWLLHIKVRRGDFPATVPAPYYVLAVFLYFLFKLVHPWDQRRGMWTTLGQLFGLPFTRVTLLSAFVGDVVLSAIKVIVDLTYAVFYLCSGEFMHPDLSPAFPSSHTWTFAVLPLASAVPLFWRLLQCLKLYSYRHTRWPFLFNAFKYAFAQIVVMFGAFDSELFDLTRTHGKFPLKVTFVIVFGISTLYTWVWDCRVDWGLWRGKGDGLLRPRLMFTHKIIYYVAMTVDLVLRFAWCLTLVPFHS